MERDANRIKTNKEEYIRRWAGILVFVYTCVILFGMGTMEQLKNGKLTVIVLTILGFFIKALNHRDKQKEDAYSFFYFSCCYIVSFGTVLLSSIWNVQEVWMLGGWIVSILVHPYIGMLYQALFSLLYSYLCGYSMIQFSYIVFIGAGMCLLLPYLRKKENVGYVVGIGFFCNALVLLCQSDFVWKNFFSMETLLKQFVFLVVIFLSMVVSWFLLGISKSGSLSFVKEGMQSFFLQEDVEEKGNTASEEANDARNQQVKEFLRLEQLGREDFSLQVQMKEKLPGRYAHCMTVANLAKYAAGEARIDAQLTYVGGLYHEIGRLRGKDYLKGNREIADEYSFPDALLNVIEEHCVVRQHAKTREGSIVMLADSVISMLEQLEIQKKQIAPAEVVKQVFRLRLEKGALAESELTLKEYAILLNAFIEWIENKQQKMSN